MRPLVPLFLVLALVASACSVSEEEVVTPTSGDPGPSTTTTGPDDVGETGPADGGDDDGAGGGVDGAATGLPQVELALVPLDTAGLDPDASFEGGFVDGGSTASLLLADDAPVVVTAGAAGVTLRAVADLVPELEPRVAPGFSHLATCAGMLVLVLTGPDAVVGVDLASGAVAWETGVAPDLQITCGDSGVVVVQDAGYVHGWSAGDGAALWSVPLDADDPLRASADFALVGTYDGVVALDPATGDEVWRLGGSGDAVVAPSPYGTVLDLDGGLTVVTTDGAVAFEADEDSLVGERWDTFVARSASGPVLVDPEGGAALGADGPTSLLGEEVVQLLGPGPAGLIWAVGYVDGDGEVVLIDGDGTVAASSGLLLLRDPDDPLPHLFIQAASGQAVVATVSGA